jgi:long-chain acyl-CoA synthetase
MQALTPAAYPSTCANAARLELDYFERFGTYTRLHYENRSYTNLEELQHAGRLARVLKERGVRPGDRVLVLLPNSPDLTASFQGIWTIGAVMCPVMPQWTAGEVAHVLHDSGASAVLTVPALAARVRDASQAIRTLRYRLVFGETDADGMYNISPEMEGASWIDTPIDRSSDDLAMLLYTSGTTAEPKGVMITHANVAAALDRASQRNPDLPVHPMLHVLPLTHVFGMIMMKLANRWGFSSVLLRQFDPLMILEAIERYQVGYLPVVPTMLMYLLHHPERTKFSFSSLYRVISGGAALPEKLRVDFQEAFRCRVDQGYGMSESLAMATSYGDHEPYRPGSAGRPEPGVELRIADGQNRPLPPGSVGEICLAGDNIAPGYWQNPAATREAFIGGWFHTGDVGYLDEDGYLYITDRKKDLIIKGGENISPREIEEAIYLHPAVAEAAVVGIPDAIFGEEICAVIQLKAGSEASEEDIRRHVGQHIAKFKVPRRIVFQDGLPKNSTGKIQKRLIREQFAAETAA